MDPEEIRALTKTQPRDALGSHPFFHQLNQRLDRGYFVIKSVQIILCEVMDNFCCRNKAMYFQGQERCERCGFILFFTVRHSR